MGEEEKLAEQTQAAPEEKSARINCGACGKPVKRIKRYYRNGKFYCDKNCWRKAIKKAKDAKEAKEKEGSK